MLYQTVQFVHLHKNIVKRDDVAAFQLRLDRPAVWLQKVCFFVLGKLRAFREDDTLVVERQIIEPATFMDRIFAQIEGIQQLFLERPTILLIGAIDYANLMNEMTQTRGFSFGAQYCIGDEVFGLTVHIIPWMKGCLVMPNKDVFSKLRY